MNKLDLVEAVVEKAGLSKKEADAAIRVALEEITEKLIAGETVKLTDFGTFDVRVRKARNGTNPKTGSHITIPETRAVGFKASRKLKDALN